MSDIWLLSYLILWVLVLGCGLVILILAREIENLHERLDHLEKLQQTKTFQQAATPTLTQSQNNPASHRIDP